jgi:hypothetical protein
VLLLVELTFLNELPQALPAAFEAVLLFVQLALLDELVDAVRSLPASLRVTI